MKLDRVDSNTTAKELQQATGQIRQLQEDLQNSHTAKRILQQRLDEKEQKSTQLEMQLAKLQS